MLQDLRVGLRFLLAAPGFTAAALLSLMLAIGSITVIFAAVNAVLLRPLPYKDAARLVAVWERDLTVREATRQDAPPGLTELSGLDFQDFRNEVKSFTDLAAFFPWNATVSDGIQPEKVDAAVVTTNLFDLLGVRPVLGRAFLPSESEKGRDQVVMISYGLWQTWRGRDPKILSKKMRLEGEEFSIVGVMPPGFDFPKGTRVWKPLVLPEGVPRNFGFLQGIARLKPGVELRSAQTDLDLITSRFAKQYPDTNADRGAWVTPWRHQLAGDFRRPLWILLAAVSFLLLIACANVSNLLLARAAARREEMTIRAALGAGRGRLIRQLLTESLLLAALGGGLGALAGFWGFHALLPFLASRLPFLEGAGLDWRIFAFTVLVSLATVLLFGLAPALQVVQENFSGVLRAGRQAGRKGLGQRLQTLTVVLQVALALMLVIGAGLLIESFTRLISVDPGFRVDQVLTMELNLMPETKYKDMAKTNSTFRELISRISHLPEVKAAGVTWGLPLNQRSGSAEVEFPGRATTEEIAVQAVSPDYFSAINIPLREGRVFTDLDDANRPPVIVVNRAMAKRYWPGGSPLGQRVTFLVDFGPAGKLEKNSREVVGVVGDTHDRGLDKETQPQIYFPIYQSTWRWVQVAVLSGTKTPIALAPAISQAVRQIDPNLAVGKVKTGEQLVAESVIQPRLSTWLLSFFAAVALILAAVGIYGVISYLVAQRTREIGVRMALGAPRRQVLWLVLKQAAWLTLSGVVLGLAAAVALTRILSSLLFGISPLDVRTFVEVTLLLVLIAGLAGYLPARRATRVDPLSALRIE